MDGSKKKPKIKSLTLKFGTAFFIIAALLTYFSSTIDNMLLPKVKVSSVTAGTLFGDDGSMKTKYLIPLSAVMPSDTNGNVFVIERNENGDTRVKVIDVDITAFDDMYYEVTSSSLFTNMEVVYKSSKDISDGDRVSVEE